MQVIQNLKTNNIGLVDEIYAPQINQRALQASDTNAESESKDAIPHGKALNRFLESSCDCV
jgi:hypothetical protein